MRKLAAVALFFGSVSLAMGQSLTEKIDVSLVNVDVTVTSHGNPARGLTREDFEVFEDGVPRPITNFYAVEPAASTAAGLASNASRDTNLADPSDERFRRKVLLIIDNRHVSKARRDRVLASLERFIDDRFTGGSYDWSIALITDTARVVLPLTSDKQKLHSALAEIRRIVANPQKFARDDIRPVATLDSSEGGRQSLVKAMETGLSPETFETIRTLSDLGTNLQIEADASRTAFAIRDAIRSFDGAPGRKIILLVTGSLSLDPGISPLEVNPYSFLSGPAYLSDGIQTSTKVRDYLVREANASNVSLFIVNSEGLSSSVDAADHFDDNNQLNSNQLAAMYWMARETGGRLMPGNSPDLSLAEFDRASSSFYSLAYKPAHEGDGKYHSIKVRIRHSGYQLHYRNGYTNVPVNAQLARAMGSSLASTMQTSQIPITIETGDVAAHDGGILVPLRASVAAKDLQFLRSGDGSVARVDLYVSVFDEHGRRVGSSRATREARAALGTEAHGEFVNTQQILLKRGAPYRLVVAVHDQLTDAIGISSKTVRF